MFGENHAKARIIDLDQHLQRERQKLNAAGAMIDKAIADTSIRDVMRRALAKVEADRRAPPSQ